MLGLPGLPGLLGCSGPWGIGWRNFFGGRPPAKTENFPPHGFGPRIGSSRHAPNRGDRAVPSLLFLVLGHARSVDNPSAIESGPGRRRKPPCRGGASAPPRASSGRFESLPRGRRPSWRRDAADASAALIRLSFLFSFIFSSRPRRPGLSDLTGARGGNGAAARAVAPPPAPWALAGGRPVFPAWVSAAPSGRRSFEKPPHPGRRRAHRLGPPRRGRGRAQQATEERTRHGFHQSDRRFGRGHVRRPVD